MSSPPSRYVQPEVDAARIERLWSGVEQRMAERPVRRPWRWLALGTALSAAAAFSFFWVENRARPGAEAARAEHAPLEGAKLETKSDELAVTLGDGSSVKLASQSEVQVQGSRASAISLSLVRGELACDVTHREGRRFTVVAGDVEVRVVGTRFSVKRTLMPAGRVEVSVARGVVEVRSARQPGVVARVAAGQDWSENAEPAASSTTAATTPAPAPPAAEGDAHGLLPPKHEAAAVASAAPTPSARELFEKAGESRRAGDAAAAARAYEELLRTHPSDARASLAAFELGRLRMDRLGDLSGAVAALERAVAMQVGPTFREDALARLVSVYASQGNFGACRRARDRYLASYPGGVHAAAVATRCGSPGQ
jgi:TolA-binding protein